MDADEVPIASREIRGPIWNVVDEITNYLEPEISELEFVVGARREEVSCEGY